MPATRRVKRRTRCGWVGSDQDLIDYHDQEWGRPVHDDRRLFEMLLLEGAQAGLSWVTILRRRENYRLAFAGFNPTAVASFDRKVKSTLLQNSGIVRNRLKIDAAVTNAQAYVAIQREFGSFDRYVWQFIGGKPVINRWKRLSEVPTTSRESDALSRDLQRRGFRFVGSTITYAFMQAVGMVNDHLVSCHRHEACSALVKKRA